MRYFLDTNVILSYLRNNNVRKFIDENYAPFASPNIPLVSVVTLGEIRSIGIRNKWGNNKLKHILAIFNKCVVVGINKKPIIDIYGRIDAFSQGKLPDQSVSFSSRNMGKNDLWIAASAVVANSKLITTDKDFEHLNNKFLEVLILKILV